MDGPSVLTKGIRVFPFNKVAKQFANGSEGSATGLLVKSDADLLLTALAPDALAIIKPPSLSAPSLAQKTLPYGLAVLPVGILSTAVFFGKRLKKKGGGSK